MEDALKTLTDSLRSTLVESATLPIGSIVKYKTSDGFDVGVVIGQDHSELLCVGAYEPALRKDPVRKHYRDVSITTRMGKALVYKGIVMDVVRVPVGRVERMGRIAGRNLRVYAELSSMLQQIRQP